MNAELCAPYSSTLIPGAVLPTHTPEEAIDELTYCVQQLGYRVAAIMPGVLRPLSVIPEAFPSAGRMDRYGIDSDFDYDPLWQTFVDLRLAVCAHGSVGLRYLDCGRHSPTNHVFNHIGGHQFMQAELAKTLILGGVPTRFPNLNFAFLEAGAGWAVELFHSLEEHWRKRGPSGIKRYDPSNIDRQELARLLSRYEIPADPLDPTGHPADAIREQGEAMTPRVQHVWVRDEFEDAGIKSLEDLITLFTAQIFVGCEAEDRSVAYAFSDVLHRLGVRFNPVYGSDIGHWDGAQIDEIILDSRELVDMGLISAEDYRQLVFDNVVRLHGGMNSSFFDGTNVATEARHLLMSARPG